MKLIPNAPKKMNPKEMLHQSYMEKVESELKTQGVVLFEPDEGNLSITPEFLQLPSHITEVHSKELGEYLNAFTQQKMYLRTLIGRVELIIEEARRAYHSASEKDYKELSSSKMSETSKERVLNSLPHVIEPYHEMCDYKRKLSVLEYSIANIEDAIFMISREVTRRCGDFSDENRNHNVGRK